MTEQTNREKALDMMHTNRGTPIVLGAEAAIIYAILDLADAVRELRGCECFGKCALCGKVKP